MVSDRFLPHVTLFGRMNVNPELFYSFFNKIKSESEIDNVQTLKIKIGDPHGRGCIFNYLYIKIL